MHARGGERLCGQTSSPPPADACCEVLNSCRIGWGDCRRGDCGAPEGANGNGWMDARSHEVGDRRHEERMFAALRGCKESGFRARLQSRAHLHAGRGERLEFARVGIQTRGNDRGRVMETAFNVRRSIGRRSKPDWRQNTVEHRGETRHPAATDRNSEKRGSNCSTARACIMTSLPEGEAHP